MKNTSLVILTIVACFPFSGSHAHHSYAGVFDMQSVAAVQGKVVKLELLNPHTNLYLQVTNEQGEIEDWVLEGPGVLSLQRRGWTEDLFEVGELITVFGNPSVQGKNTLWLDRVRRADGSELVDPLIQDIIDIEAERQRQIQRYQQQ